MKPKRMQQQAGGPLGVGRTLHRYATESTADMSMREPEPRRVQIDPEPQAVIADLNRTAIVVIDMQNDFCAKDGRVEHLGEDYTPDRAPIAPLQRLLPVLQKASWAATVDELAPEPGDIGGDKHRIGGFQDTPLDSIPRNLGTRTSLFAGLNTDRCVLHSLTDANFPGYGCVMLADCCGTTSPDFCTEATMWNVKKCSGLVRDPGGVTTALEAARAG